MAEAFGNDDNGNLTKENRVCDVYLIFARKLCTYWLDAVQ